MTRVLDVKARGTCSMRRLRPRSTSTPTGRGARPREAGITLLRAGGCPCAADPRDPLRQPDIATSRTADTRDVVAARSRRAVAQTRASLPGRDRRSGRRRARRGCRGRRHVRCPRRPAEAELVGVLQRVRPTVAARAARAVRRPRLSVRRGFVCAYSAASRWSPRSSETGARPRSAGCRSRSATSTVSAQGCGAFERRLRRTVDDAIGTLCTACSVLSSAVASGADTSPGALPDPEYRDRGATRLALRPRVLDEARDDRSALSFVKDGSSRRDALRELVRTPRRAKDRVTLAQILTHTRGCLVAAIYKEIHGSRRPRGAQRTIARADPGTLCTATSLHHATQGLAHTAMRRSLSSCASACSVRAGRDGAIPARARRRLRRDGGYDDPEAYRRYRLRGEVTRDAHAMGGTPGTRDSSARRPTYSRSPGLPRRRRDRQRPAGLARREHARGDERETGLGLALRAPDGAMIGRHMTRTPTATPASQALARAIGTETSVVLLANRVYTGARTTTHVPFRIAVHEAHPAVSA